MKAKATKGRLAKGSTRSTVIKGGKKIPEGGVTKIKETEFQKSLSTWDKKYPR